METISDKEVFLINFTAHLQIYVDVDEHFSISADKEKIIGEISSIDSFYPYLEFRTVGYDIIHDTFFDLCSVKVIADNETSIYAFKESNNSYQKVIIAPYYKEDNVDKRVIKALEKMATAIPSAFDSGLR